MDINIEAGRRLFAKFQPLCVHLAKEHTRENVQNLRKALKEEEEGIRELQEYLLFPLRIILKQQKKLSDDLYTEVCLCIHQVLSKSAVSRWEMCVDIISTLSILLSSPVQFGTDISEEMKLAVIRCLEVLVKCLNDRVVGNLYRKENLPLLGHLISLLLDIGQKERARNVRLESINCLLALMQAHSKASLQSSMSLGDVFASFLPGISIGLSKIITGDPKQGQMITVRAIEAMKQVVVLVMGDNSLPSDEQRAEKDSEKGVSDKSTERISELVVKRNCDWVKSTASKLLILIKDIVRVRSHSSWKVRSALVDWSAQLLLNCTRSLSEGVPVLLEVLVGLLRDEFEAVASKAKKSLETFSQKYMQGDSERPLVELLEDNLYSLATSLPRQIRSSDDSQKLSVLSLLSGYIQLLGPNTCGLLHSLSHLKRLSTALVQVLEFDTSDIKITEDVSHFTGHGASAVDQGSHNMVQRPRKYFKNFSSPSILQELVNICRLLGYYGDVDILVDHFLDVYSESKMYKLPSTFILNEIVVGTVSTQDVDKYHKNHIARDKVVLKPVVRMLIDEYLSPSNYNLTTSNSDEISAAMFPRSRSLHEQVTLTPEDKQPIRTLNSNILQICLFLEGFGKFSQVLGKDFIPLLIKVLYPLMEKLGDDNGFISTTAYLSLQDICVNCGYSSVDRLLQSNSDYLVNAISVKLRHLRQNPRAPLVLKVMLQHSSAELLPLVQDTIDEVLTSLDQFYGEKAVMFMKVLLSLVLAIEKWYPPVLVGNPRLFPVEKEVSSADEVVRFLEEYHRNRVIADGDVGEEEEEPVPADAAEDVAEDDTQPDPPQHIKAVKEVLLRSKHLLSSHNPRLRLLVLDTISHAVGVLSGYQNVLLPLVHEIWPPFLERFSDEEKLVTVKAFQTLAIMSSLCGDFIRKRTVKGVFPRLTQFLKAQAHTSVKTGPAYLFTADYKLQLVLLSQLGEVCCQLGIEDLELENVARACLPYLSSRQPLPLQQATVSTFVKLIDIDPDRVWLMLNYVYSPVDYLPPSVEFPEVKFGERTRKRNEYSDNVVILLEKC